MESQADSGQCSLWKKEKGGIKETQRMWKPGDMSREDRRVCEYDQLLVRCGRLLPHGRVHERGGGAQWGPT